MKTNTSLEEQLASALDALERKDRVLRGCIGIMNSGPYMDAVLVRGAIEAITKEQK